MARVLNRIAKRKNCFQKRISKKEFPKKVKILAKTYFPQQIFGTSLFLEDSFWNYHGFVLIAVISKKFITPKIIKSFYFEYDNSFIDNFDSKTKYINGSQ